MSSSCGDPSRKIPWYRKMMAKLEREAKAKEVAHRVVNPKIGSAQRRKAAIEEVVAGK